MAIQGKQDTRRSNTKVGISASWLSKRAEENATLGTQQLASLIIRDYTIRLIRLSNVSCRPEFGRGSNFDWVYGDTVRNLLLCMGVPSPWGAPPMARFARVVVPGLPHNKPRYRG